MAKLDPEVQKLENQLREPAQAARRERQPAREVLEILKGITTPAEYRLARSSIVVAERELTTVKESLAAVEKAAAETRKT